MTQGLLASWRILEVTSTANPMELGKSWQIRTAIY